LTHAQKRYFWVAAVFAILFDALYLAVNWFAANAPVASTDSFAAKATVTVGQPTITQLFQSSVISAQTMESNSGLFLTLGALVLVIYAVSNALYISLLARSVRELPSGLGEQLPAKALNLVFWSLVQITFGVLIFPIFVMLENFGFFLSVIVTLWFRFALIFIEYAIVTYGFNFSGGWVAALRIRKLAVQPQLLTLFITNIVLNGVLSYIANTFVSVLALGLLIIVNAITMTYLQHRLMRVYFAAADKWDAEEPA